MAFRHYFEHACGFDDAVEIVNLLGALLELLVFVAILLILLPLQLLFFHARFAKNDRALRHRSRLLWSGKRLLLFFLLGPRCECAAAGAREERSERTVFRPEIPFGLLLEPFYLAL